MSPILEVVAGWGLPDGVVDSVEPFDADRHLPMATEHRLTGVVHAAMRAGDLSVDHPDRVDEAHRDAMARCLLLEDRLLDAVEVLDAAGIEFRVLKGAALAHRTGRPEQREFGDNDLLVRPDRLTDAAAALERAGATRAQAAVSPLWERRFAKSITVSWQGTELDLHRTLAPGPYGLTIDGDALFSRAEVLELAGSSLPTLSPEHHLLHAAVHVALGDVTPRLGNVRDTALLLATPGLDADRVIRDVVAWGLDAPFAAGVLEADRLGAATTGIVAWARRHDDSRRDRRLLASYAERDGRFRRQAIASLGVLGWSDRVAYLRSLAAGRRA